MGTKLQRILREIEADRPSDGRRYTHFFSKALYGKFKKHCRKASVSVVLAKLMREAMDSVKERRQ